mgnify:FL=1|jgi:hypothetical protein
MLNFYQMVFKNRKKVVYVSILLVFSVLINQYYGYRGIQPIDSFFSFNAGFDVVNGYFPFKDYWTITGPFIDFSLGLFFKLFGVSWFSYILYASIFNFILTILTFYTLAKLKLNINYCFLYSILVSILAYPSAGTPYVDHQSTFTSIIAVYFFILALKTNLKIYWLLIPIILGISFLTKQTPTAHFVLIIGFLSLVHFFFNFNIKKIIFFAIGIFFFIFVFFIVILFAKIPITSFLNQYIFFPMTLGESRLEFLLPLEFNRIILRFKLIHLSSIVLLIVLIKKTTQDYRYLKSNDCLIIITLISSALALIAHQLMTINGMFIFFLIPLLCGFSHIYYQKHLNDKKYILYFLVFLSIASTLHYANKYIDKREFMDLGNVNIEKGIDAKIFDKKLNGLKWITPTNPNNPKKEISNLLEVIDIIKKDSRFKMLVTDYQFISVILSINDNSVNKYWYKRHVYPGIENKYFQIYKKFFIKKLREEKIQVVYVIKPLHQDANFGRKLFLNSILESTCIIKSSVTEILDVYELKNCKDLKN